MFKNDAFTSEINRLTEKYGIEKLRVDIENEEVQMLEFNPDFDSPISVKEVHQEIQYIIHQWRMSRVPY